MSWSYKCKPSVNHFDYKVFNSIDDINTEDWDSVEVNQNVFLSTEYLRAIEKSKIDNFSFRYCIFYIDKKPVGISYFQIIGLSRYIPDNENILEVIGTKIKNTFLNTLDPRIIVCGNVFTTGENGYLFDKSIQNELVIENISHVIFQIRTTENNAPSLVLLKEFYPSHFTDIDELRKFDFRPFEIDVNMVMNIDEEWKNTDDYLASMTTKFRTKAKSCFKKSKNLVSENFDVEDIKAHSKELIQLYNNVVNHADFQIGKFNIDTFLLLKESLLNDFILTGYFLDDELVGFKTAYLNNNELDAGYVGIDYKYNYECAVYQKILYDYVLLAINNKSTRINFGRTAEEIKSTIGAEPVEMKLFIRHKNSLSNQLIKPIIKSITPHEFSIRKPFKQKA